MTVKKMILGALDNNVYIVTGNDSKSSVLIDPAASPQRIINYLNENDLVLKAILVTHGHYDHIGAVDDLSKSFDVPVVTNQEEADMMVNADENLSQLFQASSVTGTATSIISEGAILDYGAGLTFKTIMVPGHSPNSVCYYLEESAVIFTGDTLFAGSVGRMDMYKGSPGDLVVNIKERLMVLPDETEVHPGHGMSTSIGDEKQRNPYL